VGQRLNKIPDEFEEDEQEILDYAKLKQFPKKVGIVFTEKLSEKKLLNFDQIASSHLLLQMNAVQKIFDFIVIAHDYENSFSNPPEDDENDKFFDWFDKEITEFEHSLIGRTYGIDYWIGITSIELAYKRFVRSQKRERGKKDKLFWIMTTNVWKGKNYTPPSLFEYIAITVIMCCLNFLSNDFAGSLRFHKSLKTKGCIFDFTVVKEHRRLVISNPYLCSICENRVTNIQNTLKNTYGIDLPLLEEIKRVLSREWMGSQEKLNSPIYNLRKNYGYDLDRNSGFNKKSLERFRDSIMDNSAEWIIGGVIATALSLVGAYFTILLGLGK